MKNLRLTTLILAMGTSMGVQALGVDSLIKIMDSNQEVMTVSNQDGYRQFVNLNISEVSVVDGKLVPTPYSKENIDTWSLETRPSKMILDDGQSKKFSIRYFGDQTLNKDRLYSIGVVPTPYYSEGEAPPNTVQMVVGVAPYVIVPAKQDKPLSYSVKYEDKAVVVKNLGETYFRAVVKGCDSVALKRPVRECANSSYVLSGRELRITLPEKSNQEIEVSLNTNNNTYKQTFNMTPGQVKQQ